MNHTIFMAYAGLRSRAQALEVVTNNIANINTTGFKAQKPYFKVRDEVKAEGFSPLGEAINTPVVEVHSSTDFSSGQLRQTGNPLDAALLGEGFFVVETPEGWRYTRNGNFGLNRQRELVTSDGFHVLAEGKNPQEPKRIKLPEGTVDIGTNGQVSVDGVMSAKLKLVAFQDPSLLIRVGASFFQASPEAKEIPPANPNVASGYLEQANVNAVKNVSEVINLMRGFEMLTRAIRSLTNNVDQKVINDVGKVT